MTSHLLRAPEAMSDLPVPDTQGEWKAFWEGTRRGALLIQACESCGLRQFYPRYLCTGCGARPGWLECSGIGRIHTYTIVRQNLAAPFKDNLPYVIAMVELEEGPRMMTNIIGCRVEDVHIGMAVRLEIIPSREDVHIPYFKPNR